MRPQVLDDYGTKVKTDKTDALALAQRLERYLQGNPKALAVVPVPTEAEEQKRIVTRQREQIRKERQRLAAQSRSLLLSPHRPQRNQHGSNPQGIFTSLNAATQETGLRAFGSQPRWEHPGFLQTVAGNSYFDGVRKSLSEILSKSG